MALPGQGLFAELLDGATVIQAPSHEKDKFTLIGVPMVITRVTYRPKEGKTERGFVSCEAVIADTAHIQQAIRRGWIPGVETMEEFRFLPEELVIFNDGGTGVRRQITMMLQSAGLLDIGDFEDGDWSAFDRDWSEWNSFATSTRQKLGDTDQQIDVPDFQGLKIFAVHGLRASDYTTDGIKALTWYLS